MGTSIRGSLGGFTSPARLCGALLACVAALCFAQPPAKRLPIPDAVEQTKTKDVLRDLYKNEYARATKPEQKVALAGKLLADAIATKDAHGDRYVLLKIAGDLATVNGSADVSLRAVDEIARDFDVDGDFLRLEALEKLSSSAYEAELTKTCEHCRKLSEKLSAADRYAEAARAAAAEVQAAKRTKNLTLLKAASARHEATVDIAKEFANAQAAATTLETSPTDPNANLVLGKFYCFAKQDWPRGLSMLALGSDKELAKLAEAEITADTPAKRAGCADQWFELSEKAQGATKAAQRRRAYDLYISAKSALTGLSAKKAEARLADLEPEFSGPAQPPKVGVLHVFRGHKGTAISPDSRTCVTCDDQGTLHLWNLSTLRAIRQFKGHGGVAAAAIDFTTDGRKIVSTGRDRKAHVWDVDSGAELESFEVKSDDGMNFIQLSADGKRGLFARRHRVWNYEIDKGRLVKEHDISGGHGETWFRSASADGKLVVASGFSNTVRIFDLGSGKQVTFEAPGHSYGAALSADGRFVLDAGADPTVRLRSVANVKQILAEYKGAEGHIYGVDFSADGKAILAGGASQRVYMWDQRSGKLLQTYEIGGKAQAVKSSPNGQYAVVDTEGGGVYLLGLPK